MPDVPLATGKSLAADTTGLAHFLSEVAEVGMPSGPLGGSKFSHTSIRGMGDEMTQGK